MTTEWQFKPDKTMPLDPLLECLLAIAKFYNKPSSHRAITAGLPLVDHKLTPELFKRAASKIGLSAKILKRNLREIKRNQLPTVLFLKDNQACVLQSIDENNNAQIILPESGEGFVNMPLAKLEASYFGYAIFIKPSYDFVSYTGIETKRDQSKNWLKQIFIKAIPIYSEILIASLLINIFTLASPLFVMNVYDRVVPNNAINTLWVLALGVGIVFVFDFIIRNLRAFFIDYTGKKIDTQVSANTFAQLLDLQMAARPNAIGSLTSTVQAFESFRDFITSASVSLLIDLPFALLFIAVMAILGGAIALVPLLMMPIMLAISYLVQLPLNKLIEQTHLYSGESHTVLIESLTGAETVKATRAEGLMQRKWENINQAMAKLGIKMRSLANFGANISVFMQQISIIIIVIIGVYKIGTNEMTLGALIGCVILGGRILGPIAQVATLLTRYKQAQNSVDSLDKIMQMPIERPLGKTFLHRKELKGDIEFNNVTFAYPEQQIPALNNISFKIKHGERIGIIGRIGSGKSTIEKLLLKLYQPQSGTILVDGTEIDQLDPAELRHYIGYVPQDVTLFHGTIRDNIVISAPYVDDAAVVRAAQLSGVISFVSKHPQGFDWPVYERGQNLSGGQRQAIALARSLLLDPPILIFDEPCNSMDESTIQQFLQELNTFSQGKTLILVTHKTSLLQLTNRLIVLDSGKLIVDGSKDEIFKKLTDTHKPTGGEL